MIGETIREKGQQPSCGVSDVKERVSQTEFPIAKTLGGLAILALAVAIGVWGYPELRRTIQMHSM